MPELADGQWPVVSGQELQGAENAGRTRDRLESRRHGGIAPRSLTHKLGTSTHGGIATGGRCGGCPPAQGRAGTARPSNGSCQWPVVSGQELQGAGIVSFLPEVWVSGSQFWTAPVENSASGSHLSRSSFHLPASMFLCILPRLYNRQIFKRQQFGTAKRLPFSNCHPRKNVQTRHC